MNRDVHFGVASTWTPMNWDFRFASTLITSYFVRCILYIKDSWVSSEFLAEEKGLTTNPHELTRRESRMTRICTDY